MPRTKLLVSALALALAGATTAQAQTFSNVIVFGDSLSDAGQFVGTVPGAQGSFTTNPDPVWVELVGSYYGFDVTPSNFGGYDYAFGGAQIRDPMPLGIPGPFCITSIPAGLPCQSMTTQLGWYLARTGGVVDPNALYSVWGGANDLFFNAFRAGQSPLHPFYITSAQAAANMQVSALTEVGIIKALQDKGARAILVFNLPDVGRTPDGIASGNAAGATGLAFTFNAVLNAGLGTLGDGIIPINAWGFFNELLADPAAYGISNTTGRACVPAVSVVYCSTSTLIEPNANNTYAFADGSHPSGASHRLVASIVTATLSAPGQVSMAGEIPLQLYDDHSNVINKQIFGMTSRPGSAGESNVYGALQYSQTEFNASGTTNALDSDLFAATFGADVRYSDALSLGAAVSVGNSDADNGGSSIGATGVLVSAYGIGHFGSGGYVNAILSGGSSNLSIDRRIVLGPTTRVESGSTNATHTAAELGGGFNFGSDTFKHGPFLSWTWQKVSVDGYSEDALDSTAMYFSDFERTSSVSRIGYQARGTGGNLQPFGRVAFAYENDDGLIAVQAGSNTLNGHFTLDGFQPASDWAEADLGLDYALNDATSLSLSYRGRFSDDTQDVNSINFGARYTFSQATPAPEPVAAPAEKTCSDLDDDGDGVNNCDDKCPASEAGQAIGPDGCPVPLTIDLKGVNFDFDQDTLRPDAVAILDEAISILGKYPELKVEVAGHTDSIGTEVYNQGLSERRARTVYDYLGSHGIGAERLVGPTGYGESKPIAPNANEDGSDNPEGRAQNRRTELNVQN